MIVHIFVGRYIQVAPVARRFVGGIVVEVGCSKYMGGTSFLSLADLF